jgi:hypothetical protein
MKFPPTPKTPYVFDTVQDKRIFKKLARFKNRKLSSEQEKVIRFLYSQLETNWRKPLEKFIDDLLQ